VATSLENQLVLDVAQEQLAKIAPQELPLFRAKRQAYFVGQPSDLGQVAEFGLAASTFLTPVILSVTNEVVNFLVNELVKSVGKKSSDLIIEHVKKMFKKFRPPEEKKAPLLTLDQAKRVREIAFESSPAQFTRRASCVVS
jgi:hypothetical protein